MQLAQQGKCRIHVDRPLICRLFGVVRQMRCPFGCKPERWLSDREAKQLLAAMKRLSGGVGA